MKIIAFYLPQFHEIEENNNWWGKGFTEWTNVKKSKKVWKEQYQPKEPLDDNYYDLHNVETLKWQCSLAIKYGLHGFCFYHYWFAGKLLLQAPMEMLLENPDININYCVSWANEPWARTWDGKDKEILINQEYGDQEDWIEHFNYLLPFFMDNRYIKINNMPVVVIYKSSSIEKCKEMMDCWNKLAIAQGFKSIYFVKTLREKKEDTRQLPFCSCVEFEPARTLHNQGNWLLTYERIRRRVINVINKIFSTDYPLNRIKQFREIANKSIKFKAGSGTFGGVFVGWDNTPRRGNAATYITEASKQEFESYLLEKIEITKNYYNTEYLFVNAWNEWCEGTYLEPDKKNKYKYLEIIQKCLSNYKNGKDKVGL